MTSSFCGGIDNEAKQRGDFMSTEQESTPDRGLPMMAKWDPETLAAEKAALMALEHETFGKRTLGYMKRTGPGLLQSAMTLGAGSAAASVMAGASFGYKLLWVQPLAMFLGVMMLAALGNVVLTTGERPYRAFGRESSRALVFLWALGTIVASVVWHFPQYGLAAGATRELVQTFVGVECAVKTADGSTSFTAAGYAVSFAIGLMILAINMAVVFNYGRGGRGIRLYEKFLRLIIALVILMFAVVFLSSLAKIDWTELGKGFIGYYGVPTTGDPTVDSKTWTQVLGMLGAAVGINMTFLYPYSLLAKGWGKEHRILSRWDLGMTMFLPFSVVTSLIIVAMAMTVYQGTDGVREGLQTLDAAKSLAGVLGERGGLLVFNLGLIGMTCGAISTHMVVCGFTLCEMLGFEYTTKRFRICAMTPAIGFFGVVISLPFWFPVFASALCFTMLPIAYLLFLWLNNKRSYIGDAVGKGASRFLFNAVLVIALTMAVVGAVIKVDQSVVRNPKVRSFFGVEETIGTTSDALKTETVGTDDIGTEKNGPEETGGESATGDESET
ncbi:MAG: divalent metal cation transporter [Planctomycetia bacterium]|nr:divalent metal cation transporter [Planctomycetia bacterium]